MQTGQSHCVLDVQVTFSHGTFLIYSCHVSGLSSLIYQHEAVKLQRHGGSQSSEAEFLMLGPPLLEPTSHIAYMQLANILLRQSEKSKHTAFYRLKFKVEYSVSRWEQIGKSLYSPQGSAVLKHQKLVFEELQSGEK